MKLNYSLLYDKIVSHASKRILQDSVYFEKHHIIPKCMGGSDSLSNIVKLTAKEHFICHLLLVKIYKDHKSFDKLLHAFMCMLWYHNNETQKRHKISAERYSKLREKFSRNQSKSMSGERNSNYGSFWITNPTTNETKKVKTMIYGWILGRNVEICLCKNCGSEMTTSKIKNNARINCRSCIESKKLIPKKPKTKLSEKKKNPIIEYSCVVCNNFFFTKKAKTCSEECAKIFAIKKAKEKIMVPIIDNFGNEFQSLTAASLYYDVSVETIRLRVKSGKYRKI